MAHFALKEHLTSGFLKNESYFAPNILSLYKNGIVQSHIAAYLFQLNRISLPGLGSFSVTKSPAMPDFVNRQIMAPVVSTSYSEKVDEDAADAFMQYVSKKEGISNQQADDMYRVWCGSVQQQLQEGGHVLLPGIGTLQQQNGMVVFEQEQLPKVFFPAVHAERVIHPEAEHNILVGDKETTNVEMTDYFAAEPVKKDRWWIWALVLGLLGSGIILYQVLQYGTGIFGTGNACTIETAQSNTLYRVIQ
jgi:nucleoid DNA-binding protein